MKKISQMGMIAIYLISVFIILNMYSSTSLPGFSSNNPCNLCHNDPVYSVEVSGEISVDYEEQDMWEENRQWSTNQIPMVNINNRSEIEFFQMNWLKNSSHMVFRARITDETMDANDKFAIIWNIDVSNFSIGEFLDTYSEDSTTGQVFFSNGHADLWLWKASIVGANSSGGILDYYIDTSHYNPDTTPNGMVYTYYGGLGGFGNPNGWMIWFVRELITGDTDDVQFEDGNQIQYALAHWDNSGFINHSSSFDKSLVVGNELGIIQVQYITTAVFESTTVYLEPTATTSAFTITTLAVGLLISIPLIFSFRKRK